jgi:hypothetical protein
MGTSGWIAPLTIFGRVLSLPLVLALGGCATGYHQSGFGGGYSETQLNARTFEVHFEGNGYTRAAEAQRGALHRAAELTAQSGYFGFYVVNQGTDIRTSSYTDPVNCTHIGSSTTCTGGDTTQIRKPDSSLTISMVRQDEAAQMPPNIVIYDARLVLAQMAGD